MRRYEDMSREDRASAILCDRCIEEKREPKYAVQWTKDYSKVIYHKVADLKDLPPIKEEDVRKAEAGLYDFGGECERVDRMVKEGHYPTRSDAIRAAIIRLIDIHATAYDEEGKFRQRRAENEYAEKLLDTSLREVYERIKKMIGKPVWDQKFVAKCLHGFEQCLKVLDADYDTIDLLTFHYSSQLPEVEYK